FRRHDFLERGAADDGNERLRKPLGSEDRSRPPPLARPVPARRLRPELRRRGTAGARGARARRPMTEQQKKPKTPVDTRTQRQRSASAWQEARRLIWARRGRLALGLLLMLVSRAAGLVLPATSKFLIDEVIAKHRIELLGW